ncbi:MAG: hypothetical protein KatS3mg029_0898 [Saprospiraceae bacterium]|nr:MAG: hypothetical protein KatS3mg029_0898 [Saprospiraceae bacterium]
MDATRVTLVGIGLTLATLIHPSMASLPPCTGASTEIGGKVFRDFNANGVFDNSNTFKEQPMAGVTVKAFDDDDPPALPSATATTATDGTYLLTGLAPGSTYRIEFTWSFSWLQPGAAGGTTCQFASAGSCNVDLAVNNPADYCQEDPMLFTNCYVEHNQLVGSNSTLDVLVGMPWSAGSPTALPPNVDLPAHTTLAIAKEIGTTYGLAYQRSSQSIFAAAYMKRHSGFGPSGTGAIYRYDFANDTVTTFVDLNALFGAGTTGADPHPNASTGSTQWQRDANSWDPVGKIALGDLDISEDELFLWTINLADRKLYKIPLGSATNPVPPDSASQISRYPATGNLTTLSGLNCANNATDVRPFGLGIKDGKVYVGLVCSAESTGQAADLKAFVYSFDPNTAVFAKVLEFPLNYNRGFAIRQSSTSNTPAEWNAWKTSFTVHGPVWSSEYSYPQPMLSDIVFAGNDMLIALRDRFGDQMGHDQLHPTTGNTLYRGDSAGDLLRASPNGSGGWTIENNAQSNPPGSFGPSPGANTGQGPGEGEFYYQDRFTVSGTRIHDEVTLGGLLQLAGKPYLACTQYDPVDDANEAFDGGIFWMDNNTGARARAYRVYNGGTGNPTFGKANGLGDLEAMCDPAPIEVGNRVWHDLDGDGVQDPSEPGIDGIVVKLYKDTVLLDSTTATAGGRYGFSNATSGTAPGVKYGVAQLQPGMSYALRIENYTSIPALTGTGPTVLHNGGNDPAANLRDNDAVAQNGHAVISFTTGADGFNNHDLDFGFGCPAVNFDAATTNVSCPGESNGSITLTITSGLSPFAIAWDDGAGHSGSDSGVSSPYTITSLPEGIYGISITDANGCLGTGSVALDANPAPMPSISNQSICEGDSAVFDAGPGYVSYFWSTGDTTQTITVSIQDTYFVAVTDSNGCTGVASASLIVHPRPDATIMGETTLCPGDSLFLFVADGVSFLWSTGDTTDYLQYPAAEGAVYSVTVTAANGCTATDTDTISLYPAPNPGIDGNTLICTGDSTTLTALGGIDWFWSTGATTNSITVSPPSTSNFAVTITDVNDCVGSASVTVFVMPRPAIGVLSAAQCDPDLSSWSIALAIAGADSIWVSAGTLVPIGQDSFGVENIPNGSSLMVTAVDTTTDCSSSLEVADPGCSCPVIPAPNSNGDEEICQGKPLPSLSVTVANGGLTADWYPASVGGSPLAMGTLTYNPAGAGTWYAEARDTLSGCSSATRTPVSLTIHSAPQAAISGPSSICIGDTATLVASGGISYLWNTGSTSASILVSPSSTSNYLVTVTDGNGCTATAQHALVVNETVQYSFSASICQGQTYAFGNQQLTQSGTYSDTLTAANGCDSIVTLQLTVLPNSSHSFSATICQGQTYAFGNQQLTQSGTYSDTLTAANGCDSIVTLQLTVLPNSSHSFSATICQGQAYAFGNQQLTQSGTYSDTLTAANGCDSIVTLQLTVLPNSSHSFSASICQGQTYAFGNQQLTQSGTYSDTLPAANGCDSIVTLQLTVLPNSSHSFSASICQGQAYAFGNQQLTQSGTYSDTLPAANGCDSIVTLQLTVLPNSSHSFSASICQGQAYAFGNQQLTQSGTYSDTLPAASGCDSIVTLQLTVLPNSSHSFSATICQGQAYAFGNQQLTQSGTYSDTLPAASGCDSIVTLQLTVLPNSSQSFSASICQGQAYAFGNQQLTQSGTYSDTLPAANGCDSIVTLQLTVLPNSSHSFSASICQGQTYAFGNQQLTQSGTYSDTLPAANGCDSIVTLQLTVLPNSSHSFSATICQGQTYAFGNQQLTQSGTYSDTLPAANGCDSIVTLQLTVLPNSSHSFSASICQGQLYAFGNQQLTQSGTYSDTLPAANGCDSIVTLQLTVLPNSSHSFSASICQGQSYAFGNQQLTQSGTYSDTLTAASGCDSIVTLQLTVLTAPMPNPGTVQVCPGATAQLDAGAGYVTYLWSTGDTTRTIVAGVGTYGVTVTDSAGCTGSGVGQVVEDSVLNTYITATVCQGESYNFHGQKLTTTGIYSDTLLSSNGCDSIVTVDLEVLPKFQTDLLIEICEGDSIYFNGQWLTQGTFSDTLTASNGCDSIVSLTLRLLDHTGSIQGQELCQGDTLLFGELLITQGGTYYDTLTAANGCDSILVIEVELVPASATSIADTICHGQPYFFGTHVLTQGGTYYDTLTNWLGCDSLVTLELYVLPPIQTEVDATICQGQSYTFGNQQLTQSGTYSDTLTAAGGCDSIVNLQLSVLPFLSDTIQATICQGQSYTFGNQQLSQSGTYSDTLTTPGGCDSIVTLQLSVLPFLSDTIQASICQGQTYTFANQQLSQSGTYYDTLTTPGGCDSIVTLQLSVLPFLTDSVQATICQGQTYTFGNQQLTQSGTYYDTLTSPNGCDSIVTLQLSVLPFLSDTIQATICQGQSYTFGNQQLSQSGIYSDTLTTPGGCDSIVTLQLSVQTSHHFTSTDTICPGDTIVFFGTPLTQAGSYEHRVLSSLGCDSIVVTLHIVVRDDCLLGPDLALFKNLAPSQPDTIDFGSDVRYLITVLNEGDAPAYDLVIVDRPPAGLVLSPLDTNGWTASGPDSLVFYHPGPLLPGDSLQVEIWCRLVYAASGATLLNVAEIGEARDSTGALLPDKDSTPGNGLIGEDDMGQASITGAPHDPTGFIYCDKTGKLITGGSIQVSGPGQVFIVADGSTGYYEFYTDGTPGVYTLAYFHPLGYPLSFDCPAQPDTLDPTGMPDPLVLGSDTSGAYLANPSCPANPFYLSFDLEPGDPVIHRNNLPLACAQLGARVCEDTNFNDSADSTDSPRQALLVWLFDCADTTQAIDSALTDSNGQVLFDGLAAGSYRMRFEIPSSYRTIAGSPIGSDGWSPCINLAFGQTDTTTGLCLYPCPAVDASDDQFICEGDTITLTAVAPWGQGTFSWSPTFGLSDPSSSTTQAAPPWSQHYVVSYDDALGCFSTDTTYIEVVPAGIGLVYAPDSFLTMSCGDPLPWDEPIFIDNCADSLTVRFDSTWMVQPCSSSLVRTWTATNSRGNQASFSQTLEFVDTVPPLFSFVPGDTILDCSAALPTDQAVAFDYCDPTPLVQYSEMADSTDPCGIRITRTWTAMDACGHTSTAQQVLTLIDTTAPQLVFLHPWLAGKLDGDSVWMECHDAAVFSAADAMALDDCTAGSVTFSEGGIIQGNCAQDGFIVEMICTWTATDGCGNANSVTLHMFIADTTAPAFVWVPADTTIACGQPVPPAPTPIVNDLCDTAVLSLSVDSTATPDGYRLTRTWTATDPCGNSASAQQVVTVTGCPSAPPIIFDQKQAIAWGHCEGQEQDFCVPLNLANWSDYEWTLDGQVLTLPPDTCAWRTLTSYAFSDLPILNQPGPFAAAQLELQRAKYFGNVHGR